MPGNPTSVLTLEVAILFTGVSYCGIHHPAMKQRRLVLVWSHKDIITGQSQATQPHIPAFTKSRAASEFPSRFLNIKQHRGHKMIKNCAKNIIDWFETWQYVSVNLNCGTFRLGDVIQLMNVVDLVFYGTKIRN